MNPTWDSDDYPSPERITAAGWLLVVLRGVPLAIVVFGGLLFLLIVRLAERPVFGLHRPLTPRITQSVCRAALRIIGLRRETIGAPMRRRGAAVANHASWLDIFALNAGQPVYFVSKAEVAGWPGIGWLARATGTVFIERNRARAQEQTRLFQQRLLAGHKLLFFPEGTSTDGRQVLPFKTTLFEAFLTPELRRELMIQPISVVYVAPPDADVRTYAWWGDMEFGPHLAQLLARPRQGRVTVVYHAPLALADFADRKSLAQACEKAISSAHEAYVSEA